MRIRAFAFDAVLPASRRWQATVTSCVTAVLLSLGVLVGVTARAADSVTVSFVTAWGSLGSGNGQFDSPPAAVAVAPDGSVYVADYGERVQRFTGSGGYLTQWAGGGQGVAVAADGSVYVAGGDQVQKFTADGTFVTAWGSHGTGDGEFNGAWGVAVAPDGSVYVTDVANSRVQKFTANGTYLTQWGSFGPGATFSGPYRVAVAPDGSVYVAESSNNRVQRFTADGTYLGQWGSTGSGPGQFDGPMGIAVSADGLVYVAEYLPNRVQVFTPDGTYVTQWGSPGAGPGQFYGIYDLAAGPQESLYVVDYGGYRVQKFAARLSQAITFTSAAPTGARTGGSYQVSAAGGPSGNPVVLTVAAAAGAVCTIAGSIVSLVRAGTCTINANQAGNDRYAAAPQVQQSFTVQAAPPAAPPQPAAKKTTTLTLNVTPEPAMKGDTLKAKAKLRTAAGPLANRVVRFYFRARGASTWTYRGKDATNSRGVAVQRFTARKSGVWKARYPGTPTLLPDVATDRVKVLT
jgi:DNA-binding beta-propeller fold protein YncE